MTDVQPKKTSQVSAGVSPVVAAVTGVVVGAGLAIAGVVAMKDKKNQEKVREAVDNTKDKAAELMKDVQEQASKTQDEVETSLSDGKAKAEKIANSAKNSIHESVKNIQKKVK